MLNEEHSATTTMFSPNLSTPTKVSSPDTDNKRLIPNEERNQVSSVASALLVAAGDKAGASSSVNRERQH